MNHTRFTFHVSRIAPVFALLAIALLLLLANSAAAQGAGMLDGQVVNGTAGGPAIGAGITVTLHTYQGQTELTRTLTVATTDASGRFRFDGLDTASDLMYVPEAVYLGVGYLGQEPVQFQAGQTAAQATLKVYETTDDPSQIEIDSGHLIAESLGSMLRISELYLFGNSGDRTYVGRPGADGRLSTVHVSLPEGAVGLAFGQDESPDRYVQNGSQLLDGHPVPPGQESMVEFFSYHLPATGEPIHVERSYDYNVASLNILLAEPGLTLSSQQMQSQGLQSFENRQYELYTASNLAPGTPLALDLIPGDTSGSPSGPAQPAGSGQPLKDNQGSLKALGLALVLLTAVGAVVYPLAVRGRPGRSAPTAWDRDPDARRLVAELADLDDAFEAGVVDEETYQRDRAAKMEAIRSL